MPCNHSMGKVFVENHEEILKLSRLRHNLAKYVTVCRTLRTNDYFFGLLLINVLAKSNSTFDHKYL